MISTFTPVRYAAVLVAYKTDILDDTVVAEHIKQQLNVLFRAAPPVLEGGVSLGGAIDVSFPHVAEPEVEEQPGG